MASGREETQERSHWNAQIEHICKSNSQGNALPGLFAIPTQKLLEGLATMAMLAFLFQ